MNAVSAIDAHQHIWSLGRASYKWMDPEDATLASDHTIEHALDVLDHAGIEGTVLVQSADNVEDSTVMFEAAHRSDRVRGVVGWVPLDQPVVAEKLLDRWSQEPSFCGVRNLIHTRADSEWIASSSVAPTLSMLADRGIPLDIVAVNEDHLRATIAIGARHPELRLVLDHLGHPPVKGRDDGSWAALMKDVAANPNVHAKVSGLYPVSGAMDDWRTVDLRPWLETAIELFTASRLMYGGDWPISVKAGGYQRIWNSLSELLSELDLDSRRAILSRTATEFYALD